jgi:hypothetical protein
VTLLPITCHKADHLAPTFTPISKKPQRTASPPAVKPQFLQPDANPKESNIAKEESTTALAKANIISDERQLEILKNLFQHHDKSIPKHPTVPSTEDVKKGIEKLSIAMREVHKALLKLKLIRDQQQNP